MTRTSAHSLRRLGVLAAVLAGLAGGALPGSRLAHAAPPAGTAIDNVAFGSGVHAPSGAPILFRSDTVRAVVTAVEALALVPPRGAVLAPGASGSFAHRLSNLGNVPVTVRLDLSNLLGDGFDLAATALTHDLDGDGVAEAGEPVVPPGGSVTLAPGTGLDLVVDFSVPGGAPERSLALLRLTGTSGSGATAVVTDTVATPGFAGPLVADKTASPGWASFGDVVEYAVAVANPGDSAIAGLVIHDRLPAGFVYEPGTARRDGSAVGDPAGVPGRDLAFALGDLAPRSAAVLRYRTRLGANTPLGDALNEAVAVSGPLRSNVARARVSVVGGAFADEATVMGTVYADADGDGRRGGDEPGIPGVRLYADEGSWAITDADGRYSFVNLAPRTHAVRLDPTTLPNGAEPRSTRHRDRGGSGIAFVDPKRGELHRADFAVRTSQPADSTIRRRRDALARRDPAAAAFQRPLAAQPDPAAYGDPRVRPPAGVRDATGPLPLFASSEVPEGGFTLSEPVEGTDAPAWEPSAAAIPEGEAGAPAAIPPPAAPPRPVPPLEELILATDRTLAFVGWRDGDTVRTDRITLALKGTEGFGFELRVNGELLPASRVGRRVHALATGVEAWEYYGVPLQPGANRLVAVQRGANLAPIGEARLVLVAPDRMARLEVRAPSRVPADGHTRAVVRVRALDARGVPAAGHALVTLETDRGEWATRDLDPARAGLQLAFDRGIAEAELIAPSEPSRATVTARAGEIEGGMVVPFVPDLRPLFVVGSAEGVVDLATLLRGAGARERSLAGFEQPIEQFADMSADGRASAGARAAVFARGRVSDDVLLTVGYDSERQPDAREMRDLNPDAGYPLVGDASVHGWEAQSTGYLFARVERGPAWFQYGDFTPVADAGPRSLLGYQRTLTGVQQHWDDGRLRFDAFAARERSRVQVTELPGLGTSGPYRVPGGPFEPNGERVEIVVRDREQPALVLRTEIRTRFTEYTADFRTGEILFKSPVPSMDSELNPVFVRVTWEREGGGEPAWVSGVEGRVRLDRRFEVGGTYVDDHDGAQPFEMRGVSAAATFGATRVESEFAVAGSPGGVRGPGGRLEVRHQGLRGTGLFHVEITDSQFVNRHGGVAPGRAEAGMHWNARLSDATLFVSEGMYSGDVEGDARRASVTMGLNRRLTSHARGELGVRFADQLLRDGPSEPAVIAARAKLQAQLPARPELGGFLELEQDVRDLDRRLVALGGEYRFDARGRVYLRHEVASTLFGPAALSSGDRRLATVVGVDADVASEAHVFSEYRLANAMNGRDAEAAFGLRRAWRMGDGWRVSAGLERLNPISDHSAGPTTSFTSALEALGDTAVKASARFELRSTRASDRALLTMAMASRFDAAWTAILRNSTELADERSNGTQLRDRLQVGLAFRPGYGPSWASLARYDLYYERGGLPFAATAPGAGLPLLAPGGRRIANVLSMHATGPFDRTVDVSLAAALKLLHERRDGMVVRSRAQWAYGRIAHDLGTRWDVGLHASARFADTWTNRQSSLGAELGRDLGRGVWLSLGWNRSGYDDEHLPEEAWTREGVYLRVRAKFDETLVTGGPR